MATKKKATKKVVKKTAKKTLYTIMVQSLVYGHTKEWSKSSYNNGWKNIRGPFSKDHADAILKEAKAIVDSDGLELKYKKVAVKK